MLSTVVFFAFAQTTTKNKVSKSDEHFRSKLELPDLFQPLTLDLDTTIIYLTDFFIDPKDIDSVSIPPELSWKRNKDNTITVVANDNLPVLTEMKLWHGGYAYCVLLKKSKQKLYEFTFDPKGLKYDSVQLAGDMNNWVPKKNRFQWLQLSSVTHKLSRDTSEGKKIT